MKILAANWRCIKNPEMGGAEIHFHEIFKLIVKMGHEVTAVDLNKKTVVATDLKSGKSQKNKY